MQKVTKKRIIFAGRSLVWGTLLFSTTMLLLNWNDVKTVVNGRYVIITNAQDTVMHRIGSAGLEPVQSLFSKARTAIRSIRSGLPATNAN
ncbi:hypothetical protein CJD36_011690 [Flavipsychrobacter stenotrophus]|uniref:Uncharacterized protein n=1 Tax=Flavipsychrobacter stenotrophus TaxID=2077091 RepID=A0A2S7SV85_9BACT|nr:hypothetical protein [Flavipsychrobacter stenotrophus]PQJ10628.1 hypothetical protein CJD36_011690 [Flavipsychrobacter stenotrophus]